MMKLSEAIRVGSKMRAASKRGWTDISPDGELRTCALSAAAEGAGIFTAVGNTMIPGPNWMTPVADDSVIRDESVKYSIKSRIHDEWAVVTSSRELPPCDCGKRFHVSDVVMTLVWHLHDMHGWSREAVAEWIETIEKKVEQKAAESEAQRLEIAKDLEIEP